MRRRNLVNHGFAGEPSGRLAGRTKRVGSQRRRVVLRPRDVRRRHLLIRNVVQLRDRAGAGRARRIRRRVLLTNLPLAELRGPLRFGPRERAARVLHATIFPARRADAHLHQLLRAFRLPDVFVGAAPLHAHGLADRARQQHRIFRGIIRGQAPVTAGALDPVDDDVALREAEHVRDAIARGERALRAGPDGDLVALHVRDRA